MNVDATFGNWFARFFLELGGEETVRYEALLEPVDPIRFVDKRTAPVLFQFAEPDFYVPDSTRRALVSRAAAPKDYRLYAGAGHELDDAARADRTAWLAQRLGLTAEPPGRQPPCPMICRPPVGPGRSGWRTRYRSSRRSPAWRSRCSRRPPRRGR